MLLDVPRYILVLTTVMNTLRASVQKNIKSNLEDKQRRTHRMVEKFVSLRLHQKLSTPPITTLSFSLYSEVFSG